MRETCARTQPGTEPSMHVCVVAMAFGNACIVRAEPLGATVRSHRGRACRRAGASSSTRRRVRPDAGCAAIRAGSRPDRTSGTTALRTRDPRSRPPAWSIRLGHRRPGSGRNGRAMRLPPRAWGHSVRPRQPHDRHRGTSSTRCRSPRRCRRRRHRPPRQPRRAARPSAPPGSPGGSGRKRRRGR